MRGAVTCLPGGIGQSRASAMNIHQALANRLWVDELRAVRVERGDGSRLMEWFRELDYPAAAARGSANSQEKTLRSDVPYHRMEAP